MNVLMYHYVKPTCDLPNVRHFISLEEFKRQLDFLEKNYSIVDEERYEQILDGDLAGEREVMLTFDDGLKCHYDHVYPELRRRGMTGFFFICSGCGQGDLLNVHRLQLLLAEVERKGVGDELNEYVDFRIARSDEFLGADEITLPTRFSASKSERLLKYLVNYRLDQHKAKSLLDAIEEQFEFVSAPFDFYLSPAEIRELSQNSMVIGAHGDSHRSLGSLSKERVNHEIEASIEFVKSIISSSGPLDFSYPFGNTKSYSKITDEVIRCAGLRSAFLVTQSAQYRRRIIDRYKIPRFDAVSWF